MSKFVVADELLLALHQAGILDEDYTFVRRIVIDLEVNQPARIYVEKFGDDKTLPAALSAGIRIVETEKEAGLATGMSLPGAKAGNV